MRNSRKSMFLFIGLLAIGFAAVTTTLVINGVTLFGASEDDFVIIFTKAIVDGEDKSSEVISADGKTITYTTSELAIKDDQSILDFTVKNNSTQYDAEVSIECIGGGNVGTYYKIDKQVADFIPAQTEDDGQVIVTMLKSSTEPIEEEFTCTIIANAVERDRLDETIIQGTNITWEDVDLSYTKNLGDVVTISNDDGSSEAFYIISNDGENIEMLSMYNLYVGERVVYSTRGFECSVSYENSTGIQDGSMQMYYLGTDINTSSECNIQSSNVSDNSSLTRASREYYSYSGVTKFSDSGTEYEGSIVEGYVNNYSEYLINTFDVVNSATLISKEQIEMIVGQSFTEGSYLSSLDVPEFLLGVAGYWTRSVYDDNSVWGLNDYSYFRGYSSTSSSNLGVRPVIIINADLLMRDITCRPITTCNDSGDVCWTDSDCSRDKTLGDVVSLGTDDISVEQFYIISDDGKYLQMMSMYNLYVGGEYDFSTSTWTAYENPTGIQDSTMLGFSYADTSIRRGVTAFSSHEQKGTNYSDYTGSIVEGYVNNYSNYLSDILGIENTATLLSAEEAEAFGSCDYNYDYDGYVCMNWPTFFYSTSYCTRSAYGTNDVHAIRDLYFYSYSYDRNVDLGVRPVIIISSSLIK